MKHRTVGMHTSHSIVIVENDRRLAKQLAEIAKRLTSSVSVAHSIEDSLGLLKKQTPSVLLLDRILDDGDGIELLEYVRDYQLPTQVLMVSQLGSVQDRVHGLEHGADDYLPKPFFAGECYLRLKNLLKRSVSLEPQSQLKIGPLTIHASTGMVTAAGLETQLRRKELALLMLLAQHADTTVSRSTMRDRIWGASENAPVDATLDVYMRRVRMKLRQYVCQLQTVRGYGYRLNSQDQSLSASESLHSSKHGALSGRQ
jgi:DNA-binding response OmpR family regulator